MKSIIHLNAKIRTRAVLQIGYVNIGHMDSVIIQKAVRHERLHHRLDHGIEYGFHGLVLKLLQRLLT